MLQLSTVVYQFSNMINKIQILIEVMLRFHDELSILKYLQAVKVWEPLIY